MADPLRSLAIETASEACSVALYEGDRLIARDHRVMGRGHAEQLVPMIAALPDKGKAQRIVVSLGPGSFTGLRIGIATARALGVAWQAQVLGYPTLALLAAETLANGGEAAACGKVTVCMNGGHGEWFVADFDRAGAIGEVQSLSPADACKRGAQPVIIGNRAQAFADLLDGPHVAVDRLPDAGSVHLLDHSILTRDLAPIYGRGPDATPQKQAVQ